MCASRSSSAESGLMLSMRRKSAAHFSAAFCTLGRWGPNWSPAVQVSAATGVLRLEFPGLALFLFFDRRGPIAVNERVTLVLRDIS